MSTRRKSRIAFIYDFDGTLSPKNMQEYEFIPQLKIKPKQFWQEASLRAQEQEADDILSYMTLMLEKCHASGNVRITKKDLYHYGGQVQLFPGVESWFDRLNGAAQTAGLIPQHFIISSGIREMIEGTKIAKFFTKVFASSFIYDQHDVAIWPGLAVNYTTKTQFLFRINKGALDVWDNQKVNKYVAPEQRDIPFTHMMFIGDGSTDVPCMKLIKAQGGYSVAVYRPNASSQAAQLLRDEDRVHVALPADYSSGKALESTALAFIEKVAAADRLYL